MRKHLGNLGLVSVLLVALGCNCGDKLKELANKDDSTPRPTSSPGSINAPVSKKGEYELTMDKYNQLKVGMARSEVESILGGKGTEISSSKGGGMRFSVNKWEGDNFKSIILSFRNDKIMTRAQVGLDK
ncbi:MAG: hypothetical protein IPM59_10930 [Chloracidobacterium sp.]|nr:hypothetical protein [Chloracidobacterium sp.]